MQIRLNLKSQTILLLILGGICLVFSQGRWSISLATFGYLVFMMRYINIANSKLALVAFILVHTICWDIAYTGLVPAPFPWRWIISFGFSLIIAIFFLLNRWATEKSERLYTTLLFPSGLVFFEYMVGVFGTGSGASLANTFSDQHRFAQLASITGWTGMTFMVAWTASVLNLYYQIRLRNKKSHRGLIYCGLVWAVILVYGHVRLWNSYNGKTVKVACVVGESTLPKSGEIRENILKYLKGEDLSDSLQNALIINHVKEVIDSNFQLAEKAFTSGAKIVVFPEANPVITALEEQYCQTRARELAIEHKAYLGLGYFIFQSSEGIENENKFVMIAPDGTTIWEYFKARRVPGSNHKVGDGTLPVHASEFGKMSAAICYDMDFPNLMQQTGDQKVDILFGPSNDWQAIKEIHVGMARLRVIEQGYSLVRPTGNGYSFITDPFGRITAFQNTGRPGEHILIADVSVKGVRTFYSLIGDFFSWLCIGVFFFILINIKLKSQRIEAKLSKHSLNP